MRIISPGYANTNVAALYAAAAGGGLDGSESDGTNLFDSNDIAFVGWGTYESTLTANAGTDPSGTSAAASLLETTNNDRHIAWAASKSVTSATAYTYSIYVKSITRRYVQVLIYGQSSPKIYAYFDLQSGTVTDTGSVSPDGSSAISSTNCQVGANGFYKCTLRGVLDGTSTVTNMQISLSDVATYGANVVAGAPYYVGSTSNGAYLWRPKMTT